MFKLVRLSPKSRSKMDFSIHWKGRLVSQHLCYSEDSARKIVDDMNNTVGPWRDIDHMSEFSIENIGNSKP